MLSILRKRRRKGYSLLEMIVAAFIFSAVSVALSAVFQYHYAAIGTSRLFLIGQHLARQRMEELVAAGFTSGRVLADSTPSPPVTPILVTFTIRNSPVQTEFELDDVATIIPVGAAQEVNFRVQVSWEEKNRRNGGVGNDRRRNVVYSANVAEPVI